MEDDIRENIDEWDDNGLSALHYAARFNNYSSVVVLVEEGKGGEFM